MRFLQRSVYRSMHYDEEEWEDPEVTTDTIPPTREPGTILSAKDAKWMKNADGTWRKISIETPRPVLYSPTQSYEVRFFISSSFIGCPL